jgi:uncharacterized membrane protein YcjF (UPF0283 family)
MVKWWSVIKVVFGIGFILICCEDYYIFKGRSEIAARQGEAELAARQAQAEQDLKTQIEEDLKAAQKKFCEEIEQNLKALQEKFCEEAEQDLKVQAEQNLKALQEKFCEEDNKVEIVEQIKNPIDEKAVELVNNVAQKEQTL